MGHCVAHPGYLRGFRGLSLRSRFGVFEPAMSGLRDVSALTARIAKAAIVVLALAAAGGCTNRAESPPEVAAAPLRKRPALRARDRSASCTVRDRSGCRRCGDRLHARAEEGDTHLLARCAANVFARQARAVSDARRHAQLPLRQPRTRARNLSPARPKRAHADNVALEHRLACGRGTWRRDSQRAS